MAAPASNSGARALRSTLQAALDGVPSVAPTTAAAAREARVASAVATAAAAAAGGGDDDGGGGSRRWAVYASADGVVTVADADNSFYSRVEIAAFRVAPPGSAGSGGGSGGGGGVSPPTSPVAPVAPLAAPAATLPSGDGWYDPYIFSSAAFVLPEVLAPPAADYSYTPPPPAAPAPAPASVAAAAGDASGARSPKLALPVPAAAPAAAGGKSGRVGFASSGPDTPPPATAAPLPPAVWPATACDRGLLVVVAGTAVSAAAPPPSSSTPPAAAAAPAPSKGTGATARKGGGGDSTTRGASSGGAPLATSAAAAAGGGVGTTRPTGIIRVFHVPGDAIVYGTQYSAYDHAANGAWPRHASHSLAGAPPGVGSDGETLSPRSRAAASLDYVPPVRWLAAAALPAGVTAVALSLSVDARYLSATGSDGVLRVYALTPDVITPPPPPPPVDEKAEMIRALMGGGDDDDGDSGGGASGGAGAVSRHATSWDARGGPPKPLPLVLELSPQAELEGTLAAPPAAPPALLAAASSTGGDVSPRSTGAPPASSPSSRPFSAASSRAAAPLPPPAAAPQPQPKAAGAPPPAATSPLTPPRGGSGDHDATTRSVVATRYTPVCHFVCARLRAPADAAPSSSGGGGGGGGGGDGGGSHVGPRGDGGGSVAASRAGGGSAGGRRPPTVSSVSQSRGGGAAAPGSPRIRKRGGAGGVAPITVAARAVAAPPGSDGVPVTVGAVIHWLPHSAAGPDGGAPALRGIVRYNFDTVAALRAAAAGGSNGARVVPRATGPLWMPTPSVVTASAVWPAAANWGPATRGSAPWAPLLLTGHADGSVWLWRLPAASAAPATLSVVTSGDGSGAPASAALGGVLDGRALAAHSAAGAPAGSAAGAPRLRASAGVALTSDGTRGASVSRGGQLLCFNLTGRTPPPIAGVGRDAPGSGGLFGGACVSPPPSPPPPAAAPVAGDVAAPAPPALAAAAAGGGDAGSDDGGGGGGGDSGDSGDPFATLTRDAVWAGRWDLTADVQRLTALPGSHLFCVQGTVAPGSQPPGGGGGGGSDDGSDDAALDSDRDGGSRAVVLCVDGDAGSALTAVDVTGVRAWTAASDGSVVLLAGGGGGVLRDALVRVSPAAIVIAGCPPLLQLAATGAIGDGPLAVSAYNALSLAERHVAAAGDGTAGGAGWSAITASLRRVLPLSPPSALGARPSLGGPHGGGGGMRRPGSPLGGASTLHSASIGGGTGGLGTASVPGTGGRSVRGGGGGIGGKSAAVLPPVDPSTLGLGDILALALGGGGGGGGSGGGGGGGGSGAIAGLRGGGDDSSGGAGPTAAPTDARALGTCYAAAVAASRDARAKRLAASMAAFAGTTTPAV